MNRLSTLIRPRLLGFRHRSQERGSGLKLVVFAVVGVAFWAGIFLVTHRVLSYFQAVEDFGDILAYKLLSMVLITFFSLLVFSAILTTLSKLYLSRDLNLVHSMPVPAETIFTARWIESTVDSAWMVLVYTIPVFISYGIVFAAGPFFYVNVLLVLLPLCVTASALSALLVTVTVIVLPASRIRSIFVFLGLAVLIMLYLTFRMLRPERLVDPEAFATVMGYLQQMSTPSSPLLPSTWAFDSLKAALEGRVGQALFHDALAFAGAALAFFVSLATARVFYFRGFSKTQAAMVRLFENRSERLYRLFSGLSGPVRAFVVKEIKTFWRDQTQWTQLFLLAALVVIYLYNFHVLPLDKAPIRTVYLQNLFSFLNMALAAFVLTAVTARFAYPSVSIEGGAFWIVRAAPISIRAFLWIKFAIYILPLLALTEVLIVATNILLQVTPFMMWLSTITIFFMAPGIIALGVGLGAAYPDFASENPAQAVTSFGGMLFMILSAAFIGAVIVLQSGPVYRIFMADLRGTPLTAGLLTWTAVSFAIALALCAAALILPIALRPAAPGHPHPAPAGRRQQGDRSAVRESMNRKGRRARRFNFRPQIFSIGLNSRPPGSRPLPATGVPRGRGLRCASPVPGSPG